MSIVVLWVVLHLIAAGLVYRNTVKMRQKGLEISPLVWALAVFFFSLPMLLVYLIMSWTFWQMRLEAVQDTKMSKNRRAFQTVYRLSVILAILIFMFIVAGVRLF